MLSRRYRSLYTKLVNKGRIAFLLALCGCAGWLAYDEETYRAVSNPVKNTMVAWSGGIGLTLENIYLSGRTYANQEAILAIIEASRGMPLLAVDLPEMKQRLEDMGWIEEVKIERQFPNTLHVIIREREPFALWQYRGMVSLIDREGNIIAENHPGGFTELPIIVGEDAHLHAGELFSFLTEDSFMFDTVSSVIRVGGRRWNVRLNNGIEIKLPEDNARQAWQNLLQLHHEKSLLDRKITMVDLRVPGRLFMLPDNTEETKASR